MVLLKSGTMEFKSKKDAETNVLANALFTLDNVTGVFIGKDFLTITKSDKVEWEILKPTILSTILDFFHPVDQSDIIRHRLKAQKQKYSKKMQRWLKRSMNF